jgi:small subunit ribosomal protein S18
MMDRNNDDDLDLNRGDAGLEGAARRRGGKRRICKFCADKDAVIDYKDPQALRYFITDRGKIVPRRISGTCATHQRKITLAIKQARNIALLPFTVTG